MTIGNLSSKICQIPSMNSDIMVTLLLSTIKDGNDTQKRLDEQRQTHCEELNGVLRQVHQPITEKLHPRVNSRYCTWFFARGNFWC